MFPNSEIRNVSYYGEAGPRPAGTVLTVDFVLDGQEYTALNGGPDFTFNEAISLLINCADQDEVDHADRCVLLLVGEARCNGYGDSRVPRIQRW